MPPATASQTPGVFYLKHRPAERPELSLQTCAILRKLKAVLPKSALGCLSVTGAGGWGQDTWPWGNAPCWW